VGNLHKLESGVEVDYIKSTAEDFAESHPAAFDTVTCLEMLEHVPRPENIIKSCSELVRPGGSVYFSTINKNLKAFLYAIIGAEHLLKLLPVGTHEYSKFIKPSEIDAWARDVKLELNDSVGLEYNPIFERYSLTKNLDVNYMMHFTKPASNE
jgi:2-polyprenyl-6-hydroxyphenyl methylase/3-demethylubiquinone-9 3-methyltransferase